MVSISACACLGKTPGLMLESLKNSRRPFDVYYGGPATLMDDLNEIGIGSR
jgi:hypothetical protein